LLDDPLEGFEEARHEHGGVDGLGPAMGEVVAIAGELLEESDRRHLAGRIGEHPAERPDERAIERAARQLSHAGHALDERRTAPEARIDELHPISEGAALCEASGRGVRDAFARRRGDQATVRQQRSPGMRSPDAREGPPRPRAAS
jgi:hypothetical protein